jgi:hypothetical protein
VCVCAFSTNEESAHNPLIKPIKVHDRHDEVEEV